jgi:hypothetical protein
MPTTSFTGKRANFVEQYARTVAAYQRYQDITRDIQSEQDRLNWLDSQLVAENQNLTNLQEVFRVRPQDLGSAQALLQQQYASEDAGRRRAAAGRLAREEASDITEADKARLTALATEGTQYDQGAAQGLALELIGADSTPQQTAEVLRILEAGSIDAGVISEVEARAARVARGRVPSGAARALTPEEKAAERALQQQLESAFFAGQAGIRGGYDGQAIVERRESTAAPETVSFSTEADAFDAALVAIQNGAITEDEFESAEDFQFAKKLYDEAKAKRAYRNDQRANFEQEVLKSRQRVTQLETARAEAPGAQYTDPGRERAKRELIARGFDPDKNGGRYLQYQQSPYYSAMIRADDILTDVISADMELEAVDSNQRLAADLIRQLDARGKPYDITKVEKQLGKVLKGDELQEALAFALATKEYDARGFEAPSQRALQRAAKQRAATEEEQARALDAKITDTMEGELDQQALFMQRLDRQPRDFAETREQRDAALEAKSDERAAAAATDEFRAIDLDAPDPAPTPAPVVAEVFTDPNDARLSYRRVPSGFAVFEQGKDRPTLAATGTRAFESIQSVVSGGQPLPLPTPAPVVAEVAEVAPAPTAPAGEAEPTPARKRIFEMTDDELRALAGE